MQKRGEPSVQTFSFPLTNIGGTENGNRSIDAGMMDVTIHYKNQNIQVNIYNCFLYFFN